MSVTDPFTSGALSRRHFMAGGATAMAALGLAACGGDKNEDSAGTTDSSEPSPSTTAVADGDASIAMTAASLEVLAVGTYKAALDAATAGKLGTVPPAVATFVQTAMSQHQVALDSWNAVIQKAGGQAVAQPPASLKATVDQQFAQVKDVVGAAKLALLLEQTAADTYLAVGPSISNKEAITLAGSLQCVDQEHAAILNFVLGTYPVPDVFQKTDKAFKG